MAVRGGAVVHFMAIVSLFLPNDWSGSGPLVNMPDHKVLKMTYCDSLMSFVVWKSERQNYKFEWEILVRVQNPS